MEFISYGWLQGNDLSLSKHIYIHAQYCAKNLMQVVI